MNEREAVKRKTSVQVDGDSIGGNSKERLRGRPSKTKQTRGSYAGYPRHSLEKALRIPKAILEQNAGKECSDAEAAKFSGVGCHGPFRLEISSSVKFGLLERPSPGRLKITELARKILRPQQIITIEPGKRGGKPCVRRMRITVSNVLGWLAAGMKEILEDYPELTEEDIRACLAYAADRERRAMTVVTSHEAPA